MKKISGILLLLAGLASCALANPFATPEIDPASGLNAVALITGALLVIRGSRKR